MHGAVHNTISNMPVEKVTPYQEGSGYVITWFEETPPVSSYSIVFVVSNFTSVEDADGLVTRRVFAKPESIESGDARLAFDMTNLFLSSFEHFLDFSYPLTKFELAAVPHDFAGDFLRALPSLSIFILIYLFRRHGIRSRDPP